MPVVLKDVKLHMRWLELPGGVAIAVKPLTTAISLAARWEAVRAVREYREARGDGAETDPLESGIFAEALAANLARFGAVGWRGVENETGDEVPFDADAVTVFMQLSPAHAEAFHAAYSAGEAVRLATRDAEGNGSGTASNTISTTVPASA